MPSGRPRGFTLLEMLVVVAIIGIVAALGYTTYARSLPRSRLASATTELQAALQTARQQALARGRDVGVLFYPSQATGKGRGRVVVYVDGTGGFMDGAAVVPGDPTFCTLDPANPITRAPPHDILDTVDLPNLVRFAPVAAPLALTYPYNTLPAPGATGCSFCNATMTSGGIRFDPRGNATFYSACGTPPTDGGGSISLTSTEFAGSRVLVVTRFGNVRPFNAE